MRMLEQKTTDFIEVLSSKEPVPGGGGACATVGAMAAALGLMVANLTTGKKKYAEHEPRIQELLKELTVIREDLVSLADEDAKAFEPLSKAYGLPKETPEEIRYKEETMATCLSQAALPPLRIMEKVMEALEGLEELAVIGSKIALSDVGVAAQFAKAALNGAALNVWINTKLMKNRELAQELNGRTDRMIETGNKLADQIYETVANALK